MFRKAGAALSKAGIQHPQILRTQEVVSSFRFYFTNKYRRLKNQPEPKHAVKLHFLKIMQSWAFHKEISYLKDPVNKEIPISVMDFEGILSVIHVKKSTLLPLNNPN